MTGASLFVSNLPVGISEEVLRTFLSGDGRVVHRVHIIADQITGARCGFASAEMGSASDARAAVAALDGIELEGRKLTVLSARLRRLRQEDGDPDGAPSNGA